MTASFIEESPSRKGARIDNVAGPLDARVQGFDHGSIFTRSQVGDLLGALSEEDSDRAMRLLVAQ